MSDLQSRLARAQETIKSKQRLNNVRRASDAVYWGGGAAAAGWGARKVWKSGHKHRKLGALGIAGLGAISVAGGVRDILRGNARAARYKRSQQRLSRLQKRVAPTKQFSAVEVTILRRRPCDERTVEFARREDKIRGSSGGRYPKTGVRRVKVVGTDELANRAALNIHRKTTGVDSPVIHAIRRRKVERRQNGGIPGRKSGYSKAGVSPPMVHPLPRPQHRSRNADLLFPGAAPAPTPKPKSPAPVPPKGMGMGGKLALGAAGVGLAGAGAYAYDRRRKGKTFFSARLPEKERKAFRNNMVVTGATTGAIMGMPYGGEWRTATVRSAGKKAAIRGIIGAGAGYGAYKGLDWNARRLDRKARKKTS